MRPATVAASAGLILIASGLAAQPRALSVTVGSATCMDIVETTPALPGVTARVVAPHTVELVAAMHALPPVRATATLRAGVLRLVVDPRGDGRWCQSPVRIPSVPSGPLHIVLALSRGGSAPVDAATTDVIVP